MTPPPTPPPPPPSKRKRVDEDEPGCREYELKKFKGAWSFVEVENTTMDKDHMLTILFRAWERPPTPHPSATKEAILKGVKKLHVTAMRARFEGVAYCPIYLLLEHCRKMSA